MFFLRAQVPYNIPLCSINTLHKLLQFHRHPEWHMVHGTRKSHICYEPLVSAPGFCFKLEKNGFFAQLLLEWLIAFRGWTRDQPHRIAPYHPPTI